jgi:type IV secretion system protein VirB10
MQDNDEDTANNGPEEESPYEPQGEPNEPQDGDISDNTDIPDDPANEPVEPPGPAEPDDSISQDISPDNGTDAPGVNQDENTTPSIDELPDVSGFSTEINADSFEIEEGQEEPGSNGPDEPPPADEDGQRQGSFYGGDPNENPDAGMETDTGEPIFDTLGENSGNDGTGPEEAQAELDTNPDNSDAADPYTPKKSADDVVGSKPNSLNKRLILLIISGVFISIIVFVTFIAPALNLDFTKPLNADKKTAANRNAPDYSSMVDRNGNTPGRSLQQDAANPDEAVDYAPYYSRYEDDEIPPVVIDERFQPKVQDPATQNTGIGSGASTVYVRPDTRNDRFQEKSISGIKGITPTQRQYSDGYGQVPAQPNDPSIAENPYAQFGLPTKEEYTQQAMAQYYAQNQQGQAAQGGSSYAQQNDQNNKLSFFQAGRENAGNGYWLSPYSLWQGSIFTATLTSNINTDLPGECTAMVTKNVYSSLDGKYLLIPQNSRLLGSYNSSISYAQSRVQVAWHTLIRPDGYYINLGNMQATDPRGAAGLPAFVNEHPEKYLEAIALISALNIINTELGYTTQSTTNQYVQNVMANTQEVMNTLGNKIIDRAMDIQPTLTIKSGTIINIVTNNNIILPPMQPYPVNYPYQRGK